MFRWKDIFELSVIGLALVVVAVSISVVGRAASKLWELRTGIVHALVTTFAGPLGGNLDIPVGIAAGLLTGLFVLFFADGTKRAQAVLLFLFGGVFSFIPLASRTGHILDTVTRVPLVFVIGLVLGAGAGISVTYAGPGVYPVNFNQDAKLGDRIRWPQFPAATKGFLWGASLLVVITALNYAMVTSSASEALQVLLSSVGFLIAMSVFTQYEYQRDVVVLSPPDEERGRYHPYVIGGLYARAKESYHGFPASGASDEELAAAYGMQVTSLADLPVRFKKNIGFGFLRFTLGTLSARKVTLESESWTTESIHSAINQYNRSNPGVGSVFRAVRWIRHYLGLAVPQWLIQMMGRKGDEVLDRLDHADTALLIAPPLSSREESLPDGAGAVYRNLCARYDDSLSTEVVIVLMEAGAEADALGRSLDSDRFRNQCKYRLGVDQYDCTLVPVDRFRDDQSYDGFDELLNELSD